MNFWEYREDHSQGYYLPVSNKAARKQGGQLVYGLFYLIASLFKLAAVIVTGLFSLLYKSVRWLWKRKRKSIADPPTMPGTTFLLSNTTKEKLAKEKR